MGTMMNKSTKMIEIHHSYHVNCNSDSECKLNIEAQVIQKWIKYVFLHIFYSEFFVYAFANDFSIFFNTCIGNTLYFSLRKHMGIMDITRIATTSYS